MISVSVSPRPCPVPQLPRKAATGVGVDGASSAALVVYFKCGFRVAACERGAGEQVHPHWDVPSVLLRTKPDETVLFFLRKTPASSIA